MRQPKTKNKKHTMEIFFLPVVLFFVFLAIFCWKVYRHLEIKDYETVEKNILTMAVSMSLLGFAGIVVIGYSLFKFLLISLL